MEERETAGRLARSQAGQAMMKDVAKETQKAKTFTPGGRAASGQQRLTEEHRRIYAERIEKAATVEEVRSRRNCRCSSADTNGVAGSG